MESKELEPGLRKLKMEELNRISVETFKESGKTPLAVVLDNVRSALNVGSVFRTADAFAVSEVVLCGITAQPPHREILKTALGSTESVDWSYAENAADAIGRLKKAGYIIAAVEQAEGSIGLNEANINPEQKYALIFGNEVDGVSDEAIRLSDMVIEIPQYGTKHSLNIAVSAGIVLWEFVRKIKQLQ